MIYLFLWIISSLDNTGYSRSIVHTCDLRAIMALWMHVHHPRWKGATHVDVIEKETWHTFQEYDKSNRSEMLPICNYASFFTRCSIVSSISKRIFFAFGRSRIAKGREGSRIIIAPYLYWPLLKITITSWIRSNICSFHFLADFRLGSGPVPAATTAPPSGVVLLASSFGQFL